MGARRYRRALGAAFAVVVIVAAREAAAGKKLEPAPGPLAITAEEAAIVADPAAGAQHGVVLSEEVLHDESSGGKYVITYHLRAKVLSAEGRKLGDIEVPVGKGRSGLKSFWGRTLLPDGRVLELPEAELAEQEVVKTSKWRRVVLKGVLPGVEPGAVIDVGFVVQGAGVFPFTVVDLQREWPVRKLRYRWEPDTRIPASFAASHVEGRDVKVKSEDKAIVVTGANLTPVKEEPYMPPKRELEASVVLFYGSSLDPKYFWSAQATGVDAWVTELSKRPEIRRTVAEMALPADAPFPAKLEAAYAWMDRHFVNADGWMAEEMETNATGKEGEQKMKLVVETRRGTSWQLAYAFAGLARAMGADVAIVYAVDRTVHWWNFALTTPAQFEYVFVGLRPPGRPQDPWLVVQPGAGMPYGELPWPATGSTALVCSRDGMSTTTLKPAAGEKNRSETSVRLRVDEDGALRGTWSRTSLGASGMEPRRALRRAEPADRKRRLDELCLGTGGGEVLAAEHPGLEEAGQVFRVDCDVTLGDANVAEDLDVYPFPAGGPWWPDVPELTAPARVHPVVFDYPRQDVVSLDVAAPKGFAPAEPPAPVDVQTPFGRYRWTATRTESGFHVDRSMTLLPLIVKPPDYDALKAFLKQVRAGDQIGLPFRRGTAP